MITVQQAQDIILSTTPSSAIEKITLCESKTRVLAKEIVATRNQPPFDRVMMDGIALNSNIDITNLPIQATVAAGSQQISLKDKNNCIEVMTGATLPLGCDCVIPYENIKIENNTAQIDLKDIESMRYVHKEASDYKKGDILLNPGVKITSPVCSILASQGISQISVFKVPKVIIISTGTELVDLDNKIEPHQIYMSNSYAIESELKNYGITNIKRVHIADDIIQTQKKIKEAIEEFDLLIMTGGVSKGKFDYIPQSLLNLGVKKHFHKVKQKPGKPMWYGTAGSKQIFALPGNPLSCLLCLRRYVIPSLNYSNKQDIKPIYGQLESKLTFKKDLTLYKLIKANYSESGALIFRPIDSNTSGDFYSSKDSTGFIELPAHKEIFNSGEVFKYYPWS